LLGHVGIEPGSIDRVAPFAHHLFGHLVGETVGVVEEEGDSAGELASLQGTQSGGFEWAVDDKRGFCGIQLTYSITGAVTENPSISIGGTLCERTFDFQIQG
jgi:hypothetical protein